MGIIIALLGGLVGSIVTAIISKSINDKNLKMKYITEERQNWRQNLRALVEKINSDKDLTFKQYLSTFKLYLNPSENSELIKAIEDGDEKLASDKLQELLKDEWEKSKWEAENSSWSWELLFSFFIILILLIGYQTKIFLLIKTSGILNNTKIIIDNIKLFKNLYSFILLTLWLVVVYFLGKKCYFYFKYNEKIKHWKLIGWVPPIIFIFLLLLKIRVHKEVTANNWVIFSLFCSVVFLGMYWVNDFVKKIISETEEKESKNKFLKKKKLTLGHIFYFLYCILIILVFSMVIL